MVRVESEVLPSAQCPASVRRVPVMDRHLMPAPAPLLSSLLSPTDGGAAVSTHGALSDTQIQGTRDQATRNIGAKYSIPSPVSPLQLPPTLSSAPRLLSDSYLSPCVTNKLNLAEWRTLNVALLRDVGAQLSKVDDK